MSKAERPYGAFPDGPEAEPPAGDAPARLSLRERLRATSTRTQRLQLTALVLFVAAWTFSAMDLAPRLRPAEVDELVQRAIASASPRPPAAIAIYEQVRHSVVQVTARFERPGRLDRQTGAGVVIDQAGTILTSLHIVDGANEVTVTFSDGTRSPVTVVGTLPERDVAALRATRPPAIVVPAVLGDVRALEIGDDAYVVGNPFGLDRSLSRGVISGLERRFTIPSRPAPLEGLIQFDAAVNPGSSGGPLVDRRGEVVGIVTGLVNPGGQSVFSGVGFAVPIDVAASAAGQPPY